MRTVNVFVLPPSVTSNGDSFGHKHTFKSVVMAILNRLLWPFRMAISTDLKIQMTIYAKYRFVKYRLVES